MRKTALALIVSLLVGCATTPAERRMRDSGDDDDTMRKVGIGLAVLAVGAAAYYGGRNSSGGGYAPTPPTDYDWAWDLQRGGAGGLVWVCRGIQSGQYSDQSHCAYKIQSDSQWPGY